MRKVSRRELLKAGAGTALALGAASAGVRTARADTKKKEIAVHIHGVLTGLPGTPFAGVTLAVSIDVAGRSDNLAGAGWDSGTTGTTSMVPTTTPFGPVGACYYTAAGQLNDDEIQLQGRSLFTNRPPATGTEEGGTRSDTRADGRLVQINADLDTQVIKWSLGAPPGVFNFEGQGVVTALNS